ncbi:MAG: hypothetical protein K0Q53_105 [Massilibacillus sp.]|jgi:hypothetical protein|nr:hypothetical protein [Massilibacillus sp.]
MDKNLLAFLNKEINVIKTEVIISREPTNKGTELIHFSVGEKELYQVWKNSNDNNVKPKSTGGKKPYIMLMVQEVIKLKKTSIENIEEVIGFLVLLAENIEWNTGKLINKRSKKPLKYVDLQKTYSGSKYKFEKTMKILKNNDLLTHTPEGYFISSKLIKKGKMSKE